MRSTKFKFKSSGVQANDRKYDKTESAKNTVVKIGFKTPLMNSGIDDIFDMHTDPREQIKDNLKNLLLTNHGERLGHFNFGANLKSILYDFVEDDAYKNTVSDHIRRATEQFLPSVAIDDIQLVLLSDKEKRQIADSGFATRLNIRVIFSIPTLRTDNLAVEVTMFVGG
jgi:phage baseplate assembly protein W